MSNVEYKTVATFVIKYLQFINENSDAVQELPKFADDATLIELYRLMSLTRAFDIKAINLQRTGKLGGYSSCRGQEAISVAVGHALRPQDVLVPHYRDQGAQIARGNTATEILHIWGGDEKAGIYQNQDLKEDLPTLIPIATQCLHAAGIAYAIKYRKQNRAVIVVNGDGGTSKGDFYEAINVAGEWQLPIVFVINNNQWAISVPLSKQTRAETLAQKAIAAGFEGLQVDGNDIVAVHYAIDQALVKSREGGGPTLIEAITYRLSDHTTADDAKRYQPPEEVKNAWKKEPLARLGYYLEKQGLWSREKEAELQKQLNDEVEMMIQEFLEQPEPLPTDMFDYLYAKLPAPLEEQREILLKEQL